MDFKKIGIRRSSEEIVNFKSQQFSTEINIPEEIFIFKYKLDNVERILNLRKLFEIDVHELDDITLANLRTQANHISAVRLTLGRAYEQMMEMYSEFLVNYDIWWSDKQEFARQHYWKEQVELQKKYDLAKSGMKAPTQDDVKFTALRIMGVSVEYELKEKEKISFQRKKSLYEKVDEILKSREFTLNRIIESRNSRNG